VCARSSLCDALRTFPERISRVGIPTRVEKRPFLTDRRHVKEISFSLRNCAAGRHFATQRVKKTL
jgi:hypothetical protein